MKLNKKGLILVISIILVVLVIGLILVMNNFHKKEKVYIDLDFSDGVQKLENFDSSNYYKIGWLQVQGTNIDLPILDFSASFDEFDYSFGWISPNYVTGQNREVLLGHNVLNVSSSPMLSNDMLKDFESLMSFSYYKFAEDNLYLQYTKNGKNEVYLIYAISFYDYSEDDGESFSDSKLLKNYIEEVRKNSIYDYDIDVNENDTLLTLKTCTRYFGYNEKQQFIIDARKLRDGEETLKYTVKKNKNFDQLIKSSEIN